MHCEQFSEYLNDLVDQRKDPSLDPTICTHAEQCPACANLLATWQQIDDTVLDVLFSVPATGNRCVSSPASIEDTFASITPGKQRIAAWAVLATAVCWMLLSSNPVNHELRESSPKADVPEILLTSSAPELQLREMNLRMGEPQWWGELAGATLRPVQPIADGIRPLTNSFQSAIQILTPRPTQRPTDHPNPPDDFSAQRDGPFQVTA